MCASAILLAAAFTAAGFKAPPPGYGEVPFWWWTGEKLDKERIAWQLEELHSKGVSGTQINYCHNRTGGWKTMPVEPAIFSEEWWDVFVFAAEKSHELGMGIGLSGYTLDWPGRDNLFRELGIDSEETRGTVLEARESPASPYGIEVVPVRRPETLDPLNPESARRVIDRFFKPFWDRVPEAAHDALNYFFQDELRLSGNSHLWCDDFPDEFKARKGYDIVPLLPGLFTDIGENTAKVRLDYNDVMTALEGERYFKPIYDWHASRGRIYACDPATRGTVPDEFGDYMAAMRWYTAPGFDTPGGSADPVKCKMGSSISHLYRRPRVWLEGYHSQGWQASTASIFDATVHNYVYGANLLNLHGLYYSTYGSWWEWAPPCYHFRQPYWAHIQHTFRYFERLSYALTCGSHVCDVAIAVPLEPVVVDSRRGMDSVNLSHSLVKLLAVDGSVDCDFIDRDSIVAAEIGKTSDGAVALKVSGEEYRIVILPKMFAIYEESRRKLDEFEKAGGTVIAAETLDDVLPAVSSDRDVRGPAGLKCHHRRTAERDIYYLVDLPAGAEVSFRTDRSPEVWNLWTGETGTEKISASLSGGRVDVKFDPLVPGPKLVVFDRSKKCEETAQEPFVSEPVATVALDGEWDFRILPTMDNRWGDFRRPASEETIGPEVRRMRWVEKGVDQNLMYGPQFYMDGEPYEFSWRYNVFGKPCDQNNHHGLNAVVGDYFLILGPYSESFGAFYNVMPPPGADENAEIHEFETFVYASAATKARILFGSEPPFPYGDEHVGEWSSPSLLSLEIGGRAFSPDDIVKLEPGYTKVAFSTRGFGRAYLMLKDSEAMEKRRLEELSMGWYGSMTCLAFDPFGGEEKTGTFTASVPPGTVDAEIDVYGEVLEKRIENGVLSVKVAFAPGHVGGNAFKKEIRLVMEPAKTMLGDWARCEGMRCYSGGAEYRRKFNLAGTGSRAMLDLGGVGCSAEVVVNGGEPKCVTCPPYEVDVTGDLAEGENEVSVTVYNTLNNHYQTVPSRYKVPVEQSPSGLLGPVSLKIY
ncbi:MAG: hypothetical protein ILO34_03075 [Kiritimatiellae bacterium]|nr:hypothetical protein [Kiritimatiellia bacterium]